MKLIEMLILMAILFLFAGCEPGGASDGDDTTNVNVEPNQININLYSGNGDTYPQITTNENGEVIFPEE